MTTPITSRSFLWGAVAALVALVAAMAALVLAYGANPAQAAGDCSTTSGTTTCTFGPTGSEDTFVVPAGVDAIHVEAIGAPGAVGGFSGGSAGRGARVSGDLQVAPGQTLYVEVGGVPTGPGPSDCFAPVDCVGGFNGGGTSFFGGGGGGASDVRTVSRDQSASLGSRLIVAAGGGGSGEGAECERNILAGGAGGDAGSPGERGASCFRSGSSLAGGTGGGAGTQSAGGAAGIPACNIGCVTASLGQGGGCLEHPCNTPLTVSGGGGGGGYYGGGAGGQAAGPDDNDNSAPAGGGGGGSNLVPQGGRATLDASGDPAVTISYQVPRCTVTGTTTTCPFGPTGSEDTFVVPKGVDTIHVVATGAPGAVGDGGGAAGRGATVSGDLAVTPGQTLYVNVGGTPTGGAGCFGNVACHGGFNGGGTSSVSGGGGGASDVRTLSRSGNPFDSLFSRLIVAAGGGGSGSKGSCESGPGGGDAGSAGGNGDTCAGGRGGTGGGAGTQSDGGFGGDLDGQSGVLGLGGGGIDGDESDNGGGGGGGLFGGGAGGDTDCGAGCGAQGGGGGGSNLVPQGGSADLASGDPSVAISYQRGLGSGPPTNNKQACQKGGWKELDFKNQGACIKAMNAEN